MKKALRYTFVLLIVVSMMFASNAHAKWWIFGQSEGTAEFRYLYLNGISYDEMGPKATLYRDALPGGLITIKGRATTPNNQIGAIQVSIDGKAKWDKARMSDDGSFEYVFTPELGKEYKVYIKAIDTTGKTNDIEKTRKEIIVSALNIQAIIRNALDNLIAAYQDEDAMKFMAQISDDFVGDKTNLSRAVRKDFTAFDNIRLGYTLNNVTSDSKSKIFVLINFTRMLTSVKSGKTLRDSGMTEFVFQLGDQLPKIFSMKYPLIFGVSDPQDIATGTVAQSANQKIIVLDNRGNVGEVPYNEAKKQVQGDKVEGGGTITARMQNINFWTWFTFADESFSQANGDIMFEGNAMVLKNGSRYKFLGQQSVDQIIEVPDQASYTPAGQPIFNVAVGQAYALYLTSGKYVVIEITRIANQQATIRYKYQPNGTRYF